MALWLFATMSPVFHGGNAEKKYPIAFIMFYIESGKHRIIVDPGCDTMPGLHIRNLRRRMLSSAVSGQKVSDRCILLFGKEQSLC